jgi:hypothetical protein
MPATASPTRGASTPRRVLCEVLRGTIAARLSEREGSFTPERESIHLELRAVNTRPENVLVNGEEADWGYEEAGGKILVRAGRRTPARRL